MSVRQQTGGNGKEVFLECELNTSPQFTHAGPIRVLLVCDSALLLAGLGHMFSSWPRIELVGAERRPKQAMLDVAQLDPDVVVLDLWRTGCARLEEIQDWRANCEAKLLVVKSAAHVSSLGDLFEAGADGVLAQEAKPHEVYLAMELLAAGHSYLSPELRSPPMTIFRLDELSRDFLRLMALGRGAQEISDRLGLAAEEVSRRRRDLMSDLGNPGPSQLTRLAIREGLLPH